MKCTKPKANPREWTWTTRALDILRGAGSRNLWLALALMAFGLSITALAALGIKADVEAAAQLEFDFICNEIQLNITDRLESNAQTLYSGAALFAASEIVSREEWRVFTGHLRLEQHLPGTQGIGFSLLIAPAQLEAHIQEILAEGFPDYTVQPAGERPIYTSIIYLEPFSGRNLRAFGYDMFSEPVRRAAMERARDENTTALSGKVILVQETGQDVQAGTLMYVPVYQHGMPIDTLEQRRAAIFGWVYSPYRMTDLMRGALKGWDVKQQDRQITLQVYDGDGVSADSLLYDSQSAADKALDAKSTISKLSPLNFGGQRWTLRITQSGGLASMADTSSVWLVVAVGTGISLLLFGLMLSILRTQASARRIAELNVELEKQAGTDALTGINNHRSLLKLAEREFEVAIRYQQPLAMMFFDIDHFKQVNDTFGHATGDEALKKTIQTVCATLRSADLIGRYGGDEFVILLPQTSAQEALPLAERIHADINAMQLDTNKGALKLTLSIGIAESLHNVPQPESVEDLLLRADQALYTAKQNGRNCTMLFSDAMGGR